MAQLTLQDVMQWLYNHELNARIESHWDAGYTVALGDDYNGFVAQGAFYELDDATTWLYETALQHYPNLGYADKVLGKQE